MGRLGFGIAYASRLERRFRPTMFQRSAYPPKPLYHPSPRKGHIQGFLLRCLTLTGSYRLKLSRDPRISAWCQRFQVSPPRPSTFLHSHQPTCQDWVTPFISVRPPMPIFTASYQTGFVLVTEPPVSVSPNTRFGLGRRRVATPQRPSQPHQPALPGMQL